MNSRIEFYRSAKSRHQETESTEEYIMDLCKLIHDLTQTKTAPYEGKTLYIYRTPNGYEIDFRGHSFRVHEDDGDIFTASSSFKAEDMIILLEEEYKLKIQK